MNKQVIGRGHESRGLYILDPIVLRPIACSGVTTSFETHCRLGHPSLLVFEKIVSPFFKLVNVVILRL